MLYQSFISNNSFLKGTNVIIGVSGGVDSMTLLNLCHNFCKSVYVVHVNYQLRGAHSDADQDLVESTCKTLGIKCKVITPDIKLLKGDGINLQQAARDIRYLAYSEMLEEEKADYILTGHTMDDSIETMVFNFFRGTDIKGLTGISNQEVIKRPLLSFYKEDIYQYAKSNSIAFREDLSNQTEVYTRNLIRRSILPTMEQHLPNITTRLQVTQQHISRAERFNTQIIDYLSQQLVEDDDEGLMIQFEKLDELEFGEVFLIYWGRQYGFTTTQMEQIFATRQVGKWIESQQWKLTVEREGYQLSPCKSNAGIKPLEIPAAGFSLLLPAYKLLITDQLDNLTSQNHRIGIDKSLLQFPLTIRTWQHGDRITYRQKPRESKKLKKLFNDHKLTTLQKSTTPILVNGDGEIIWVIGLQQDVRFLGDGGYELSVRVP